MTIKQQEIARVHVEIDAAIDALRERLHGAMRSWADVHALNTDPQALVEDQREAIHNYGDILTAIRGALGAVEDVDLVEDVRRLQTESEGRRKALEQVAEERRMEWVRAERAEADVQALRAALHQYVNGPGPFEGVRKVFSQDHPGDFLLAIVQAALTYQDAVSSWSPDSAQPEQGEDARRALFDRLNEWRKGHV